MFVADFSEQRAVGVIDLGIFRAMVGHHVEGRQAGQDGREQGAGQENRARAPTALRARRSTPQVVAVTGCRKG